MKKSTLFPLFFCFAQILFSQTSKTVDINAGGLSSAITESERATLTHLTVTGTMDGNDYYFIRVSLPVISFVDISGTETSTNVVPNSAFYQNQTLSKVILSKKCRRIEDWAFYDCNSLKEVVLPDSLEYIGYHGFAYSEQLKTISQFPQKLTSLGSYCFYNCHALSSELIFPPNIKDIPYGSFHNCHNIPRIVLPDSLQTIGAYAFVNMYKSSGQLVIPEKVTTIEHNAFNGNKYESCLVKPLVPPAMAPGSSFGYIKTFYVPSASKTLYRTTSAWAGEIIIGGNQPVEVVINMNSPGTLGDRILQQVEYLKDVNKLKVSGPMNDADMAIIQSNMTDLFSIDLSETDITSIPNSFFQSKRNYLEIKLPLNLETIGSQLFYDCINLRELTIPSKVKTMGDYTFYGCYRIRKVTLPGGMTTINNYNFQYCYDLQKVIFPDSLTNIGYSNFYQCSALDSVYLPDKLTYIQNDQFNGCTSLKTLKLPANLNTINGYAFHNCTSLRRVTLPQNLVTMRDYAFYSCPIDTLVLPAKLKTLTYGVFHNCTSLKDITCLQPTPPVVDNDIFSGVNRTTATLRVPFWSANMYKQANVWSLFATITPYTTEVKDIPISGTLVLSQNIRPTGFPNVTLLNSGRLEVGGNAPFTIDNFSLECSPNGGAWGSLINNSPAMSANKLNAKFDVNGSEWYFLSFPFNVSVADIRTSNGALFVVRTYNGATRALNGNSGNWVNLNNDSILYAGRGYIVNANKGTQFTFPATEATKNQLFRSDIRSFTLTDYQAVAQANKSWNFTGNPYPSFYDSRYIQCTAPITVWDPTYDTYKAVSLIDDKYAVKPFEAFFVQKPEDLPQISFVPEGRLNTPILPATGPSGMPAKVKGLYAQERQLINLTLSNDEFTDGTRVVINPAASTAYEIYCDASKFMSVNPGIPQLYSLDADLTRLAINERPLEEGIVGMGYYAGNSGSYKIAAPELLNNEVWEVLLTDKTNNRVTSLITDSYDFSTTAGYFDNRFELRIQKVTSDNQEIEDGKTIISVVDEKLLVRTKAGSQLNIFTLNGVMIHSTLTTEQNTLITLPKGVYLIKVNTGVFKSVVL